MRVLFTTQPGTDMFNPLISFGQALVDARHEVAVACVASFCPVVEAAGFATFPAGIDWRNDELTWSFADAPPPGSARIPCTVRGVGCRYTVEESIDCVATPTRGVARVSHEILRDEACPVTS